MRSKNQTLKPGERVRLSPGGPVYTVVRVNSCAAYVRNETRTTVTIGEGDGARTFEASDGGVVAIAPTAFVERLR